MGEKIKYEIVVDADDFNRKITQSTSTLGGFGAKLAIGTAGLAAMGAGAALLTKQFISIADTYTMIDGRLKLVTDSTEQLERVQDQLYKTSLKTHQGYEQTATLYTGLARATKELGTSEEDLLSITESLNKATVVSGASQEEASNSLRQMNQALQGGVVRAEEYNSIMEQTPRVLQAVAQGLGVSMGELRKEMLDGQLTAERFLQGFKDGAAGIDKEFDQLPTTVSQAMTDLETVFESVINDANKASGATGGIADSIIKVANVIDENREVITDVFVGIISAAAATVEGIGNVVRSIQGLAIVAASADKSIFDWIKSGPEDMKAWQAEIDNGTAFLKDRLVEVREKIDDVQNSWGSWADKKDKIAALRAEETALLSQIESRGKIEVEVAQKTVKATETVTVAKKKATEAVLDEYEKTDAALNKYFKDLDKTIEKEAERTKKIQESTKATEQHILALNGIERATNSVEDSWMTLIDLNKEYEKSTEVTVKEMGSDWSKFADGVKYSMTSILGDSLRGEFDSWGDAFGALTDRMLSMFIGMIAEMVAAWAAAGIAGMFTGQGLSGFSISGGSGSGSSVGGTVGGLATTAATSYAKEYAMTEVVAPVAEAVVGYFTGTGAAAAITAGSLSGASVASGTATPAILDAYVAYQATTAAGTTAAGTTAGTTAAGSGAGAATATGALGSAFIALPAVLFAIGQLVGNDQGMRMNNAGVRPEDLLGAGLIDTLTLLKGEQGFGGISEVLGNLEDNMGQYAAASYSAADSTAILASAQRGEGGLIDSMQFTAVVFDEASGQWVQQTGLFQDMMAEMENLGPVTDEAIAKTSAYVAEMYGIPSAADELALAFGGVGEGVYNLADIMGGAANQMSGIVSAAHAELASIYSRGEESIHGGNQDEWLTEINNVPGFASGGFHRGGWRMVGEDGPELEYTLPSRIFSNSDSKRMLTDAAKSSGQPTVIHNHFYVDGKEIASTIMPSVDRHVANRQQQGVIGRALI